MLTKMLRIAEVARILDVPVARAYTMAREGVFPCVKLGRQVRVDPAAFEEWIKSGGKPLPHGWRKEQP